MKYTILTEGNNDKHVLHQLLKCDLSNIQDCGGLSDLLAKTLPQVIKASYERVLIVCDADDNRADLVDRLVNELTKCHGSPWSTVDTVTWTSSTMDLQIWLWTWPNNTDPGILENLVERMVPTSELQLLTYAESATMNIPIKKFPSKKLLKAVVHAFLAWSREPGVPMGRAIGYNILDKNVKEVSSLTNWFKTSLI
jgi:5S rRNA maturation endonuclease (ribonuclease M5)